MIFDIRDYGAVGDGKTYATKAVQTAIDDCTKAGGGCVLVEGGSYLIGTIILKENVELHLTATAVLQASRNYEDFPEREDVKHVETAMLPRGRNACIIFAEECKNIAITGPGVIDCGGDAYVIPVENASMPFKRLDLPTPPRAVFFTGCSDVRITEVTMRNQPAGWSYWIHDCDFVTIDKIKIKARIDYPNNDGIHINCCRDVTISNSMITCADDCIVVRANSISLKENKPCERVVVTNCTLKTWCNAVRLGWIRDGVIRNCTFSNLVITDSAVGIGIVFPNRGSKRLMDEGREYTLVENISFDNIIFDRGHSCPIWIDIQKHPDTTCIGIRNLFFSNMRCRSMELPFISGREDAELKNLYFNNCSFEKLPSSAWEQRCNYGARSMLIYNSEKNNPLIIRYAENIVFNNTSFTTRD